MTADEMTPEMLMDDIHWLSRNGAWFRVLAGEGGDENSSVSFWKTIHEERLREEIHEERLREEIHEERLREEKCSNKSHTVKIAEGTSEP